MALAIVCIGKSTGSFKFYEKLLTQLQLLETMGKDITNNEYTRKSCINSLRFDQT